MRLGARDAGANRRTARAEGQSCPDGRGSLGGNFGPLDSRSNDRPHGDSQQPVLSREALECALLDLLTDAVEVCGEQALTAEEFAHGFVGGLGLQVDLELLISAEEMALLGSSLGVIRWGYHSNGESLTAMPHLSPRSV